jgi:hypothetical protein
LCKDLVLVSS